MGFLDHSTNNILVDAVLTDVGRRKLASSGFEVSFFSLGDDEIDYDIIKQFGRNVGKEKIEKNTPVLEAFTQSSLGQKYKLTSISNETLTHLPVIEILNITNNLITFSRSLKNNSVTINPKFKNTQDAAIPLQVADDTVEIELDNKFIRLVGANAPIRVSRSNMATYSIGTARSSEKEFDGSLNISLKSITQKDFNKFSIASGAYIRTFIKITGVKSGAQKIVEVRIS